MTKKSMLYHYILQILVFLGICLTMSFSEAGYQLSGQINAPEGTVIRLSYHYKDLDFRDSAVVSNNGFKLRGELPETVICTLSNSANNQMRIFLAENKLMVVSGNLIQFYGLRIDQASQNDLFNEFHEKSGAIGVLYRSDLKKSGTDAHEKSGPAYFSYRQRIDSLTRAFVMINRNSAVAALAMTESYLNRPDVKMAAVCYQLLSEKGKKTVYAQRVLQFTKADKAIVPGKMAPEIILKNLNGETVKLSDYRGKFVLIDFWASWCAPCRKEHPNLRNLYRNFGSDRFTILSISLDAMSTSWREAVKADQLSWPQLNDPRALNGTVSDNYGVKSIPFNCIIDSEGKILATNVRGEALEAYVAEMLKK